MCDKIEEWMVYCRSRATSDLQHCLEMYEDFLEGPKEELRGLIPDELLREEEDPS